MHNVGGGNGMHRIWDLQVGKEPEGDFTKAGEWENKKTREGSALWKYSSMRTC